MSQTYIRDMLFVRNLERRLGRRLHEEEIDLEYLSWKYKNIQPYEVELPDGEREKLNFPRLLNPDDLITYFTVNMNDGNSQAPKCDPAE